MNTTQKFSVTLDSVRSAAASPASAYLIRTRLKRAILDCTRFAASCCGLPLPNLLGEWRPPSSASRQVRELVAKCDEIRAKTLHFCQPSEALDIRWEENWESLQLDLDELEALVFVISPESPSKAR